MKVTMIEKGNVKIAVVESDELLIEDTQTAIDFTMTVKYDTGCDGIIISKDSVVEEFFKLSSGIAGDILQKFINYHVQIAIYGDYSHYTSKPLKDFIYESNKGKDIYFTQTLEEAVDKMTKRN
jgi:hypothetical protein